jgi:leucyl/phenylalanyl-tRNA--protein transferase
VEPDWFPPLEQALRDPPGLLAAGGDLSPTRLLAAYERGVFPWYSAQQPILWWSPIRAWSCFPTNSSSRAVLRKTLRNGPYTTRVDTAFGATIRECAAPRRSGPETWLNEDMIRAYEQLHALGFGHSIETYQGDRLVGGLYGIQLGGVFFGESMFSRESDASKVAMARLVDECARATSRSSTARSRALTWRAWAPARSRARICRPAKAHARLEPAIVGQKHRSKLL